MSKKLSRRQFLKALGGAGAGMATIGFLGKTLPRVIAQALNEHLYLPLVQRGGTSSKTGTPTATTTLSPGETGTATPTATGTATPTATDTTIPGPSPTPTITRTPGVGPRVVHVHSTGATSWNGSDTQYWNFVDQNAVNAMVDEGMMAVTGTSSVADAWHSLLPGYQPGNGIAIKVSFNNSFPCGGNSTAIDSIIEPVNALVRGLKQYGVSESDVSIFDAIRALPDRFVNGCLYNEVKFYDNGCHTSSGWASNDPDAFVGFSPISGIPTPPAVRISDVLINSTFVINIPIMKKHSPAGISLSFKNHFGSIKNPADLHDYVFPNWQYFRPDYNPLVDIYRNPNIISKTILTIGDGLFAAKMYNQPPTGWFTFSGKVPNSLFFSTDPVAIDCVMCDFLEAETTIIDESDNYLKLASGTGMGTYERGDPWGSGYSLIDYQKLIQ